jgi:hypothetical protein
MKLQEVTSYNLKSQTILNESWQVLTESQRLHIGAWEKRVWPLMEQLNTLFEAELTADQIEKIFTSAEQVANATGNNRTALGKAGDVTKEVSTKIKAEIDKLIKQAADSEPVKNMDAQFDKLRAQLATKVKDMPGGTKILAGVDKWKGFAQENPAKSAFIIGAMTSVLAFASGGIMSGAAIGFFLRLANNTIKGDKLSTAIGKGAKGAALGAVAGALGDAISSDEIEVAKAATQDAPAPVKAELDSTEVVDSADGASEEEVAKELPDLQSAKDAYAERIANRIGTGDVPYEMIEKISDTLVVQGDYPDGNWRMGLPEGSTMLRGEIFLTPEESAAWNEFRQGKDLGQLLGKEGTDWLKANVEGADEMISADEAEAAARRAEIEADEILPDEEVEALSDKELSTRMQELKAGEGFDPNGDSDEAREYRQLNRELQSRKFDFGYDYGDKEPVLDSIEEQLWSAFEQYQLNEAPNFAAAMSGAAKGIGKVAAKGADAVSKVAAKGAEKAGAAINTAKNDLGNKVTANKLMRMWKKAGSPTDMGSVVNILSQAGIPDTQIGTVGKQANVKLEKPAAPAVDVKSLAAEIQKAGVADIVKQMLSQGSAQPKAKAPAFDKEKFRARADRARSMKAKPVRSDMYTDVENTDA